jgi:GAF domain-containing protein
MLQINTNTLPIKKVTEGSNYNNDDLFQIKDFMLVQRVIQRINSILDLNTLLEKIIEDASKTLGFTKCGVLLYDEKDDQLQLVAVTGWQDKIHIVGDRFVDGEGIVWRAFKQQKVIYYPDISEFPEEIPCDFTSQSHIDIPLISQGQVIGILNAQHKDKDGFSKHKIRVLKTLAAHVSVAIQNAKLFEAEKMEKKNNIERVARGKSNTTEIVSKRFNKS